MTAKTTATTTTTTTTSTPSTTTDAVMTSGPISTRTVSRSSIADHPPQTHHEPTAAAHGNERGSALIRISIAALGVVYGDIGTSPLYALRECFLQPHGVAIRTENVF